MNTEYDTSINISLSKSNELRVDVRKAMLPEAIRLCLAAIEAMCKQSLSRADTPELKQALEEDMYEMINLGASTLLDKLFPEISNRPDLTVDAIMKAEDELFSKDPEKYAKAYAESAQAQKDIYEHAQMGAQLAAQELPQNRAQRRHPNTPKKTH